MVEKLRGALMRVQQARTDDARRDELLQLAASDLRWLLTWAEEMEDKPFDDAT